MTLNHDEYDLLTKIAEKSKMDCWFLIKQTKKGEDYVYDLEEGKRLSLTLPSAVPVLLPTGTLRSTLEKLEDLLLYPPGLLHPIPYSPASLRRTPERGNHGDQCPTAEHTCKPPRTEVLSLQNVVNEFAHRSDISSL